MSSADDAYAGVLVSRVDFYVLADDAPDARLRYACRLAEQAVERGERVYLQTAGAAEAQRLDDLLWTFNDRSFLPHEIFSGAPAAHDRVMIMLGEAPAPATHRRLLINLTELVPADLGQLRTHRGNRRRRSRSQAQRS